MVVSVTKHVLTIQSTVQHSPRTPTPTLSCQLHFYCNCQEGGEPLVGDPLPLPRPNTCHGLRKYARNGSYILTVGLDLLAYFSLQSFVSFLCRHNQSLLYFFKSFLTVAPFTTMLAPTLLALAGLVSTSTAGYVLQDDYEPSSFFSEFTFFTVDQ